MSGIKIDYVRVIAVTGDLLLEDEINDVLEAEAERGVCTDIKISVISDSAFAVVICFSEKKLLHD